MKNKHLGQKLTGIGILAIAVGLVLEKANIIPDVPILFIISITVISILLLNFIIKQKIFPSLFFSSLLFHILNQRFNWIKIDLGTSLLVILLVYIGLTLLLPKKKKIKKFKIIGTDEQSTNVIFGEKTFYLNNKTNYHEINTIFGETTLYFQQDTDQLDLITLDTNVVFGELRIIISKEWEIIDNIGIVFGERRGFETTHEKTKKLIINGNCVFGTIQIDAL